METCSLRIRGRSGRGVGCNRRNIATTAITKNWSRVSVFMKLLHFSEKCYLDDSWTSPFDGNDNSSFCESSTKTSSSVEEPLIELSSPKPSSIGWTWDDFGRPILAKIETDD